MKIDLHVHSTYSDGIHPPRKLVEMAIGLGLAAISITDHDCLDGTEECATAAYQNGLEVISGVELSCEFKERDLHVLGYGVDPDDQRLQGMLKRFRDTRLERGFKIIEKLRSLGVHLDTEEVLAKSRDGALGRPHIAKALLENGYVDNYSEAFERYIGEDGPAYIKKYKLHPREAVSYIRSAGGLAFIAHPTNSLKDANELLELIAIGFDGLEVAHPNQTEGERAELEAIAKDYDLLASGGSDYHGFAGKDIPMGVPEIPYEFLERIKQRLG
ncbi:MAG: PHP domain-containing protein [Candidatus Latescibacteria bacterium]|nr:PHP domain-containing protein [Candidatus Latescibacterota bacterium]NIM66356.1 PHP domain-containing protein [Candidatus Latescibacterota bacterium]NIO02835.1 PHP domain-containing protein [Candidatus Latescibacterota bacterium]NIO29970.1 PHP domain-containing protein [Candidatus Latescibacterota bacterium]NIO57585.1 PHP domain-containing protein [Candidatus Latescibacterota bacterium]